MLRRFLALLLIAGFTTGPLLAQADPFAGHWKLVEATDTMTVTKVGANTYAFDFGGATETIAVDGTFQPGYRDTMLSVAAKGSSWTVVRKQGDRTLLTATWTLSRDGNTLYDDFTNIAADGSRSNATFSYLRKAPGPGFAGTWTGLIEPLGSVIELQVRPYGSGGLSFVLPSQTIDATFDGNDSRRIHANAVEITRKARGAIVWTRVFQLSDDLKTLTMTVHLPGQTDPRVYIFERLATGS